MNGHDGLKIGLDIAANGSDQNEAEEAQTPITRQETGLVGAREDGGLKMALVANWPFLQSDGPIGGFSVAEVGAYLMDRWFPFSLTALNYVCRYLRTRGVQEPPKISLCVIYHTFRASFADCYCVY